MVFYVEVMEGVINKPTTVSSLVFLHHADDILSYSKWCTYGQTNVYCFRQLPNHLSHTTIQSISCIAGEGIGWLSTELNKILCNKRQNQTSYSVSNVLTTHLVWRYLRVTTTTSQISQGKGMSITNVKKRIACAACMSKLCLHWWCSYLSLGLQQLLESWFWRKVGPNDNLIFESLRS
jgi:hypothetical protein